MMKLVILPEKLAVCHMAPEQEIPAWVWQRRTLLSITYTRDELSLVCTQDSVPPEVVSEQGWRAFQVQGPLDFSLTGILAALAGPLATGGIPIFVLSTFETDYILVREQHLSAAKALLEQEGHLVTSFS
jgi:hypothetical protein